MNINTHNWALCALICLPFYNLFRAVKLPWIFPGAPLSFNGAPGNIQGNSTTLSVCLIFSLFLPPSICVSFPTLCLSVCVRVSILDLVLSLVPSVNPVSLRLFIHPCLFHLLTMNWFAWFETPLSILWMIRAHTRIDFSHSISYVIICYVAIDPTL